MSKFKLVDILANLSGHSRNRLAKFVISPYHNTHPLVMRLAEYMLDTAIFDSKAAFEVLYPEEPFEMQKLRNVMSYFQKLLDKFLVYEAMEEDESEQALQLLKIYRKQQERKAFQAIRTQLEKQLENAVLQNADTLFKAFQLHEQEYALELNENRLSPKSVQKILDKLDAYYLANRFKYSVIAKSHESVANTKYDLGWMEALLQFANEDKYKEIPAIQVYYWSYLALIDLEKEDYYFQFKEQLKKNVSLFSPNEQKDLYLLAINYCIKKTNKGHSHFIKELFELYKDGLGLGVFLDNNVLSRFSFKNIVSVALKLEEFDWAQQFITDYCDFVESEYRKDFKNYSLAKWHQLKGNYKEALALFQEVSQRDTLIHADTKVSLVKIYYELNEMEALDYLFDSFKAFLHRNKQLSDYHKKSYLNFVKFAKKLMSANVKSKKEKLLALVVDVADLPDKQWFLKQLDK